MENNEKPSEASSLRAADEAPFGAWLREQREKKKISLEEIAAVTKVHISQLANIENGKNTDLPASAFVRGFLINYARHVGLEETEVLKRYRQSLSPNIQKELGIAKSARAAQAATNPKVKVVHTPSFQNAPGAKGVDEKPAKWTQPKFYLIAAGVVVVLATITLLVMLGKRSREATVEAPPATEETAQTNAAPANAPAAPVASPAAGAPAAKAGEATATNAAPGTTAAAAIAVSGAPTDVAAPKNQLELRSSEATWLSVRVDEASLQSMTLKPGVPFTTGLQRRAQIYLSNAGVVELRWNGTWYESPGFRGDVKSLVLPDQLGELKVRTAPAVVKPRPKPVAPPPEAAAPTE